MYKRLELNITLGLSGLYVLLLLLDNMRLGNMTILAAKAAICCFTSTVGASASSRRMRESSTWSPMREDDELHSIEDWILILQKTQNSTALGVSSCLIRLTSATLNSQIPHQSTTQYTRSPDSKKLIHLMRSSASWRLVLKRHWTL